MGALIPYVPKPALWEYFVRLGVGAVCAREGAAERRETKGTEDAPEIGKAGKEGPLRSLSLIHI